jgi:hypothetical protein
MAYFPHAFQKVFVGTAGISTKKTQPTLDLVAGELGVINAADNKILDIAAASPAFKDSPMIYLAQGSFHPSDKKGPFHGGYKETIKSKGINPKYVHRFFVTTPQEAQSHSILVGSAEPVQYAENTTYYLRIDAKGSPVLRTLTRNAYHTVDAFTECVTGQGVDPAIVMEQFAQHVNEDPILGQFVKGTPQYITFEMTDADNDAGTPDVRTKIEHGDVKPANWSTLANADKAAQLLLETAYTDTRFSDVVWDRHEHFELEPIQIFASFWDFTGNPCAENLFPVAEVTEAKQGSGYGETLLKELILSNRYLQDHFQDNLRLREVMGDTSMTQLDRSAKYITYNILHSIPIKGNQSSSLNSDQYLLKIVVNERTAAFENFLVKLMESAGNPVALEVL